MLNIPAIRWGKPYESLEVAEIQHFETGEPIANISQTNGGLVQRDMRKAQQARDVLRDFTCDALIDKLGEAAELYMTADLPLGDGVQSPDDFVRAQSASTGLPEKMCRANMKKNAFVMSNMRQILECLTRGLDLSILSRGFGAEGRGPIVSFQAQSPVLGLVLPSNSPGVHTLWLPAIPMQIGLVLKPGSQEPWTAYRVVSAFTQAGIPAEASSLYPGGHDVGGAVMTHCPRSMIFGGLQTIEQHKGNPKVQVHGPGFSKVLLGEDACDDWEQYLDLMVESVYSNGGRSCINASSIWTPRHGKEIAAALAERLGPIEPAPAADPQAGLAAFTQPEVARGVWQAVEKDLAADGVSDMTGDYGERLVDKERYAYLLPVVAFAASPEAPIVQKEYMFPFATVVECPQEKMLEKIGYTLVCSAITGNEQFRRQLTDAVHIDRLNIGAIPTNKLDWLQPHEGNIVDFLFRQRAYQLAE
ncbi:MAG: aldehyde dehydrogenase family protein [Pirellulales bacterium]